MIEIYHNPRCSKSRAGLQYIKEHTDDYKIIEYLKDPFDEAKLKKIIVKLNITPFDLVRTQEALYKSDLKGKNFTDDEWIKILLENPKLIKRPIVVKDNKAIWGVPAEEIQKLL